MSSPSENGTVSSSGRSSPEDGIGGINSSFARRYSTPAQSFLPPRFWAQGQQSTSSNSYDASSFPRRTSFGTTFSNGGRLSALSALGMSPHNNPALYGYASNNSSNGGSTRPGAQPLSASSQQQQNSFNTGDNSSQRDLSPSNAHRNQWKQALMRNHSNEAVILSADSTPLPSAPSSPVQKPQKRSVCLLPGPDGLCVESRGRRRSDAQR